MFLKCLKTVDSIRKQVIIILRHLSKIISELSKTAKAMIISFFMNFFYYMYLFQQIGFLQFFKDVALSRWESRKIWEKNKLKHNHSIY